YGRLFDFELRGKSGDMAFIDLGDQFLALQKGRQQPADEGRHFGLVVDDKEAVRKALADAGIEPLPGLALALALAFTGPAFAGDVTAAKNEADCKKAGGEWDSKMNMCMEKKM